MNLQGFFRSTKFRVLLCVLALLVGVMLYSLKQGAHTDALTRALRAAVAPVQRFSAAITENVNEKLDTYFLSKAYQEENARLWGQIAKLNEQLIGYDDAMKELDALRDQLAIQEKYDGLVMSAPCRVLLPVTNDLTGSFRINQGSEDGIPLDAPVICSEGLVGVVTELDRHSATVTTILSSEISVGAVVLETGDSGIVEGTLKYASEQRTKMIYLDEENTVKPGDLVMTAGSTGIFPYGIPIGNVTETNMEETGLTAYAVVAPSVDFQSLESVTVLLDFEGKEDAFHED